MISDLEQGLPSPDLFADVVVVGAGAAGIALTIELARRGKRVTLLEGGGAAAEPRSQALYRAELRGLPHRGVHEGRFRLHGGTTTQWGGQILELEADDFATRSWIPGSGWPLAKADLAPFYARALEVEGVSGALPHDREVWRALGEVPPPLPDLDLYLSRWCPEPNFARLHQQTLANDPRVDVWLHANAVELLMPNQEAVGVRCRTLTGRETVFRAHHYVFALGAVETSRFFLQPRAGALPWNQSGLLGHHFQDHIDSDAATIRPRSARDFHQIFDSIFLRGFKYNPKLRLTRKQQREARVLSAGGTVFSVSSADETIAEVKRTARHLLHGRFGDVTAGAVGNLARHAPLVARQALRYILQHRGFHPAGAELRLRVHCEQEPLSASTLTLSAERDALGLLRPSLDWQISPLELRTIQTFVETARNSMASLAEVTPHPALNDPSAFLAHCQDSFHHMGGMRMDFSPSRGVVDPNLKLHGTTNTFVCSGAVFPTSGFSNPTHTLLALAMRLATHLSQAPAAKQVGQQLLSSSAFYSAASRRDRIPVTA